MHDGQMTSPSFPQPTQWMGKSRSRAERVRLRSVVWIVVGGKLGILPSLESAWALGIIPRSGVQNSVGPVGELAWVVRGPLVHVARHSAGRAGVLAGGDPHTVATDALYDGAAPRRGREPSFTADQAILIEVVNAKLRI